MNTKLSIQIISVMVLVILFTSNQYFVPGALPPPVDKQIIPDQKTLAMNEVELDRSNISLTNPNMLNVSSSSQILSSSGDLNSIWDFSYSGSSVNAQGGYVTGNFQMHGPFYARGNFRLSGSTGFFDGPLYVKSEAAIPGESGIGFNDSLSGDIDIDGSATLGTAGTPVQIFVDSECPDCVSAPYCYCNVTYGPGIPDMQLPTLSSASMEAMYLAADFLWDPPQFSSNDVRNISSMDANQNFSITYGSTPSFDYTFTDRNDDTNPSGTGHFKWDLPTNTLTVDGTVFIDGSINFIGGNGEIFKYQGKGTLYTNGDINLNNERFRAANVSDFPVTSALGLVTTGTVTFTGNNCPACSGSDPAYQLAVFGTTGVRVLKQTHIKGSLISGALSFEQVPDIYSESLLSSNLPPDLPTSTWNLNQAPIIQFIEPQQNNLTVCRDATFWVYAVDPEDLDNISVSIAITNPSYPDWAQVLASGDHVSSYDITFDWDSSTVTDDATAYNLLAIATDTSGKQNSTSRTIFLDNQPAGWTGGAIVSATYDGTEVDISWNAATNVPSFFEYTLIRRDLTDNNTIVSGPFSSIVTATSDSTVLPGHQYEYVLRTTNACGITSASSQDAGGTASVTIPGGIVTTTTTEPPTTTTISTTSTSTTTTESTTTSTTSTTEPPTTSTTTSSTTTTTSLPPIVRFEEDSQDIVYSNGCWQNYENELLSGGAAMIAQKSPCRATFAFTGTEIKFISAKARNLGKAKIYVDGVYQKTIDLYSSETDSQVDVYSKTFPSINAHTLRVEATGTKNWRSRGTYIIVDAFDVN